jgi:hypothetical protein
MPFVNPALTQRQFTASAATTAPPPLNVTSVNNPGGGAGTVPAPRPGVGGAVPLQPAQPIVELDPSDRTTWPKYGGFAFSPTPAVSGV